jgi:mannosyl-oligosaccharide glucosidase
MFPVLYLAQTLSTVPPESLPNNELYKALKDFVPRLSKWLRWLYSTQLTDGFPAWSGRSSDHNLASGLDDYPRSQVVNAKERHVDLHCWLLFFSKGLSTLAQLLDQTEERELFTQDYEKMRKEFETWFYDKESGLYNDFLGVQWVPKSTRKLRFSWRGDNQCGKEHPLPSGEPSECNPYSDSPCCSEFGWCGNTQSHCKCQQCAKAFPLDQRRDYMAVEMFSPHVGYVTLFPLIHGVLKIGDPAYTKLLQVMHNRDQLWTHFGLRSLSKSDELYKTGENYWRGNVWININYLVLRALKVYYWEDESAQKVYNELRDNVITAVYIEWNSTRSLYEQYSDENGRGRRSRAFYGWSALTLLMLQELY